jgi:hypothetical protein
LAGGARRDEDGARSSGAAFPVSVFMSDPTAEAERVTRALRARGCAVVDVPQSMLVARVAVQRPRVILLDADGVGALDVAARIRQIPDAEDIHVLFLGRPGGAVASPEDAVARAGGGLFVRPVDVSALVERVVALVGTAEPPSAPPSVLPRSVPAHPMVSSGPSLPPASMRVPDPIVADGGSLRKLAGIAPPVSAELQQLLAEAEQRANATQGKESTAPSPDEEIEAVLPAELLASLDEALDEDEDEDDVAAPHRAPSTGSGTGRERTDGGGSRTTGASTTGSGATPAAPATQGPVAKESVPPPTEMASRTQAESQGSNAEATPAREDEGDASLAFPPVLGGGDATRAVARAIALRTTASLCFAVDGIERRVLFREGDIATAASTGPEETLLAFLGTRGDLPRETVRRLATKFPPFGRHGGAALVAKGYLRQDQMWPTLRAHSEWVVTRVLQMGHGILALEPEAPGRLAAEPNVFGGSSGAEVFVDLVRRTVPSEEAIARLGGLSSRLLAGPSTALLEETALGAPDLEAMRAAVGQSLRDLLDRAPDGDRATVILALAELGVFEVVEAGAEGDDADRGSAPDVAALDTEAVRERVRARLQVVEDGDYFAVLGVARDATGYEVRRAYLDLRRSFDASHVLTVETAALAPEVRKITSVLDEAYEILKDGARRERYRRAIEASPDLP